jgi:hypothetical protein
VASNTRNLVEEHMQLGQAWIEAEKQRIGILQKILNDNSAKCTMDYPEALFREYEAALSEAGRANRAYFQWLAEQGIQSR